jgi:hypothetical protein
MAEEPRRRGSKALAASALLHLAGLALLLRLLPARPPSAEREPTPGPAIEISLSEAAPVAALTAPALSPAPPPVPSPVPRPKVRATPGPSPGPAGAPATPPPPGGEPKAAEPAPPPAAPPPAAPPRAAPPRAVPRVELSFDALRDGAKQRAAGSSSAGETSEAPMVPPPSLHGRLAPGELRADAERSADAVENVRVGRAHPLLFDYLRGARDLLTPEATRIAESLPLGPGPTTKGWGRGYLGRVAAVNRHAAADLPEEPDPSIGGRRPDVLGGYREAERQAASGAEARSAEICLGVAPGRDVVVTLRRSSGNAALDRVALSSFESAGRARPVAADIRPGLACYLVRVSAFRMPPLPSISLGWKKGHPDVIYPLKRITKVTVELESVDFGARRGPQSLVDPR